VGVGVVGYVDEDALGSSKDPLGAGSEVLAIASGLPARDCSRGNPGIGGRDIDADVDTEAEAEGVVFGMLGLALVGCWGLEAEADP